jgi:hypothetical protein
LRILLTAPRPAGLGKIFESAADTDIMYASCMMVSKGYSTSGRCRPSQYQNRPFSQAAFSSEKSR